MPLHPCPSCSCHVATDVGACPHCGASLAIVGAGSRDLRLPAAALLMGLALTACTFPQPQAKYGIAINDTSDLVDADEDGFAAADDCDDDDAAINPEAEETPGDGVDSNCDDEDDT
ncbi:MAG: MopE-related protein [Pseudomonadota bacterium]|nr:MopE-related protein [Pseudomonadota bacterium]